VRQFVFILLIGTCALLSSACSVNRQSSPPAVGDACLVGNWSLDQEVSPSGWLYANTPVSVAGLRGARLTLGADGTETEAFAGSSPLVGALADGRVLSITIRGSFTFHLHSDGNQYVESGAVTTMSVAATINGAVIPDYHGSYSPGTGTYSCSQRTLTTTTRPDLQTDTATRR